MDLPSGTCVTPALETQGMAEITGDETLHWLGEGVHTPSSSPGGTAQPARRESMWHNAGTATTSCPLLLHAFHPLPVPRQQPTVPAAGQTTTKPWEWPFCVLLFLSPDPPAPATAPAPGGGNHKFRAREWVVYPSHSLQQEGEKKSLIQDTKKICIKQLCSVNETCILKRWRTRTIITWGSAWPFNWFTDPPSENAGVHLVKRM